MELSKLNKPLPLAKAQTIPESRFELSVEGMTCVKCTGKVEEALRGSGISLKNPKVDFISNRVLVTVINKGDIEILSQKIQAIGFKVKSYKDISHTLSGDKRMLTLKISSGDKYIIERVLFSEGAPLLEEAPRFLGDKCMITYNSVQVRGSELLKKLEDLDTKEGKLTFTIENCFEEDIDSIKFSDFCVKQLIIVLTMNILNISLSFIPEEYMYIPKRFGLFSYYYLAVFILTIMNLKFIGFKIYSTCIKQLIASFHINMLTLVSIGSGLALIFGFIYSGLGLFHMLSNGIEHAHMAIMNACHMFHTSATIFTSLVVGKYIEGRIKKRIYSRIDDLKKKLQVKIDAVERIVPRNKSFAALLKEELLPMLIEKDDYIIIKNAGMIPFDGFIEKGTIKVIENVQYGWEKVETKSKGHPIISGSQAVDVQEPVIIRVTEPLEKTLAGRLFYEIKEAASGSSVEGAGDILAHITKYFITVVLITALMTLLGWSLAMAMNANSNEVDFSYPFEKAIAVLVASCPCALGIAIPMVYAIALRKAFKAGVLIKDTGSLSALLDIDTVIFDKTGTITGTYNVKEVKNIGKKYDDASLWEIVSILEKEHLKHPVGLALFQESLQRLSALEKPKYNVVRNEQMKGSNQYFASEGIIENGIFANETQLQLALGNSKLLERLKVSYIPQQDCIAVDLAQQPGQSGDLEAQVDKKGVETNLYLCVDKEVQLRITLSLQENLKSSALEVITQLHQKNKNVQILSGDARVNALQIAKALNIPESNVFAEMCPEGKEKHIKHLVEVQKKKVMMVGDGINDIKAFKAATLSCSINFKCSQNLTYSDFIVINNDLETISGVFNLANVTSYFKTGILVCALLYNVPVILAASGILRRWNGLDLAAYLACWTMVVFSLFLTVLANLMEFIDIKRSLNKDSKVSRFFKYISKMKGTKKFNSLYGKALKEADYLKLEGEENFNQPTKQNEDL